MGEKAVMEYKEYGLTLTQWRYILFTMVIASVAYTLTFPVKLPAPIDPRSQGFFNTIDTLTPNDVVLIIPDCGFIPFHVNTPGMRAVMSLITQKHASFVTIIFAVTAEVGMKQFYTNAQPIIDKAGYIYGVDYVNLGYAAGMETAMAAFARDIHKLFATDAYKTPLTDLPLMKRVLTAKDFSLVYVISDQVWESLGEIRQIVTAYGLKGVFMGGQGMDVSWAPWYPYPIVGLATGFRGMAEMEMLCKVTGTGVARLSGIHFFNFVVTFGLILGNVFLFYPKIKKGRKK